MPQTLQNIIFPTAQDPDVLALYSDPETWTVMKRKPVRLSERASIDNILSRSSYRVDAGQRVSFASYFNAFPAAYWQRWTVVQNVTLRVRTKGEGTLVVYRSNSGGAQQRVISQRVSGETESLVELPLNSFGDGGWYWFDLIAGSRDLELLGGEWTTEAEDVMHGQLSLGMTTFNKPDYCVATLQNIAADPELVKNIDQILLVDQGTKLVSEEPDFPAVAAMLGDKLRVIRQGNLGGSGGFSRAMAETLELPETDFLLLLDDDIEFDTESALRALRFARLSREPVLVGGHMFDLLDKPVLHAWAEIMRPGPFLWGPSFPEQNRHDFRRANLRQTPWMHARLDADYNGWWMCLIPKKVIQEIGLSIPVFIKWDDAEYGLRAKEHGFRTVSMPGVALWHISWLDKDDTQDWQAYFHTRNRLVAALLHSRKPKGGSVLSNSGRQDLKKLLNMQYYAVQLSVDGLRDVLAGPASMHTTMAQSMPKARALAADYPETKVYRPGDPDTPVATHGRALPLVNKKPVYPLGVRLAAFTVKNTVLHWFRAGNENRPPKPDLEFAKRDALWWVIPSQSSVIIGTADGSGKAWYRHDRAKFRSLAWESRKLTKQIERNWDRLAKEYQRALPEITSVEEWKKTFNGR